MKPYYRDSEKAPEKMFKDQYQQFPIRYSMNDNAKLIKMMLMSYFIGEKYRGTFDLSNNLKELWTVDS